MGALHLVDLSCRDSPRLCSPTMRLFGQSWVFALWQLVHLDFAGFNPLESFYMFFLYLPRFSSAES